MKLSITPSCEGGSKAMDPDTVNVNIYEGGPVIAIDFDGTLVKKEPATGQVPDGDEFLPEMVAYIKHLLEHGDPKYGKVDVWIFTARVCDPKHAPRTEPIIRAACKKEFGRDFFVTAVKSCRIVRIVDDRACRAEENTGKLCPTCKSHYKM